MIAMDMLLKCAIFIFIFINIAIPGGDIFGVNIKILSLIFLLILFVFLRFNIKLIRINHIELVFIALFIWILISSLIAYQGDILPYFIFMELRVILPLFLITSLFWFLYSAKQGLSKFLVKTLSISIIFFATYKIFIEIFFLIGVMDLEVIMSISKYWGGEVPVYSEMPFGMIRIFWTKPDYILAISPLLFLFFFEKYGYKKYIWPALLIVSLGVLIGYSRALMTVYVFFTMLGILHKYSLTRIILVVLPVLSILLVISLPFLSELYLMRVSDQYTGIADEGRLIQMYSLIETWVDHLIFGSGLGSNAELVREVSLPFVYEIWMLSFFMKTGLIGFLLFMIFLMAVNIDLLKTLKRSKRLGLESNTVIAIFWLFNISILISFSNQYLPSIVTATILGVFVYLYRDQYAHKPNRH